MQGLVLKFQSLKNMVIKNERRQNGMSKKDPFKINLRFLLIALLEQWTLLTLVTGRARSRE